MQAGHFLGILCLFICMDPDKRERTFLVADVVIDGTPVDAEEDAGFLHRISSFREYHDRLYLLYIGHKHSFGCKKTHAESFLQ